MTQLLTEIADYDEPGSWDKASWDWPSLTGDSAYHMFVFANQTGVIPYGSYVLINERGRYGATESLMRVLPEYIDRLQSEFELAGRPTPEFSVARRVASGQAYAPKWW